MKSKKPLFITFEGPDGSGKSTISKKFFEYLQQNNISSIWTREPGGNDVSISEQIRSIILSPNNKEISPITEALLFAASRAQHIEQLIKPSLKKDITVVCDRYIHSSLAYQGYARGLGIKEILKLNKFATEGLMPDIIYYIDVPYHVGLERINSSNRNKDRMDNESDNHHKNVCEGYKKVVKKVKSNYVIIDGTKSIEEVLDSVIRYYNNLTKG